MKPHYFDQDASDADDMMLAMARQQGYVPAGCLLGGTTVMGVAMAGSDPCKGCECPREKCEGRAKAE